MKLSRQALNLSLIIMMCPAVQAHDQTLYDMLLQNKVITQTQYDSLTRNKAPDRPLNSDRLLHGILLENGAITKAQYETLLAGDHPAPSPATPVIPETAQFKLSSESGDFQL